MIVAVPAPSAMPMAVATTTAPQAAQVPRRRKGPMRVIILWGPRGGGERRHILFMMRTLGAAAFIVGLAASGYSCLRGQGGVHCFRTVSPMCLGGWQPLRAAAVTPPVLPLRELGGAAVSGRRSQCARGGPCLACQEGPPLLPPVVLAWRARKGHLRCLAAFLAACPGAFGPSLRGLPRPSPYSGVRPS